VFVVGALQDASRIPALPALPELEEPLDPELEDPLEREPLDPALEELLAPELLVDPEPDEPPDSSHALASKRTATSARTNFSSRRIDQERVECTWVASQVFLGQDAFQVVGIMGLARAPLNASRMRARRASVRWLSVAEISTRKA
jgi:hypothetical protein